jgi:putative transcriptional regulator
MKNRLKEIRHDHRMNQTKFSSHIGVTRSLYNKWEHQHSQPNQDWMLKLAQRLYMKVEDIFYLE